MRRHGHRARLRRQWVEINVGVSMLKARRLGFERMLQAERVEQIGRFLPYPQAECRIDLGSYT